MRLKASLLTMVIALGVLQDFDGTAAQRRRRDPPGVKTFDEGEIITSDPNSMRNLQTQFRLADTRIMDYMRDSTAAIQQGHRLAAQHFAVWFRKYENAKENASAEMAKAIMKQVLTRTLQIVFPEAAPFIEVVKSVAENSMDAVDKLLAMPAQDVNMFIDKLRAAEEEHVRRLLDTPAQFRKDYPAELQAAKMEYLDVWMQDETRGPQGQELPESVRQMLDTLGVPKPGAETAQKVAEGVLTTHIHTILSNDEMFRRGAGPYSYWTFATVEALMQMDRKGNTARICDVERGYHDFYRRIPKKECDAARQ